MNQIKVGSIIKDNGDFVDLEWSWEEGRLICLSENMGDSGVWDIARIDPEDFYLFCKGFIGVYDRKKTSQ